MIDSEVLAIVPEVLRGDFTAGSVYRVGMLLFRKGRPGIVGHLVETSAMAPAISSLAAANPYFMAAKVVVDAAGHVAANVQLHQVKAAVETLKVLQLSTIALSGAGLGVSIISHVLISARLSRMKEQIQALDENLDRIAKSIDDLRQDSIERDFIDLRSACERADQGWIARSPEKEWLQAEESLHGLQNLFAAKIRSILTQANNLDTIEPFVDALALASATRISCRIAAGDLDLAHAISVQFAQEFAQLLQPVGSACIVQSQLERRSISAGSPSYLVEAQKLLPYAEEKAAAYREREDIAATTPVTIQRLKQLGIDGREFLERARSEAEEPLLTLLGDALG